MVPLGKTVDEGSRIDVITSELVIEQLSHGPIHITG